MGKTFEQGLHWRIVIQMANRCTKISLPSWVIKGSQIKTNMRHHYMLIRMDKRKKRQKILCAGKIVNNWIFLPCWDNSTFIHLGKLFGNSTNTENMEPHHPTIPFWGTDSTDVCTDVHQKMGAGKLTAALSQTGLRHKLFKRPPTVEWFLFHCGVFTQWITT